MEPPIQRQDVRVFVIPVGTGRAAAMEAKVAYPPNAAKVKQSNDDMSK